ncbi:hypothetical protein NNJEOMEG_02206 [Fundidesulfovibrio magnetotacticus]|uniref:Uncharacterized protein n=1 Tax=Fundidesulfovibrio magnetotacticus TaxID=2730080 RepID=A0A6V8LP72_9BACT|nr:hypothetical protein NNJEOMEG_02206 [Fundidesulfovibrio magnetotacticus]
MNRPPGPPLAKGIPSASGCPLAPDVPPGERRAETDPDAP